MQLNPLQTSSTDDVYMKARLQTTNENLLSELRQYPHILLFLSIMGLLWPESDWTMLGKMLQYAWSGTVRLFLIWTAAYGIYFAVNVFDGAKEVGVFVFIGISIFLQASILIPTSIFMHRRLFSKCLDIELDFFPKSIGFSVFVFLFSIVCGVGFELTVYCDGDITSCNGNMTIPLSVLNGVGQLAMSCVLSVNTMFVLVDSQVSVKLVQKLIEAHNDKKMTIAMFNEYRDNIRQRVDSNYWTYNSVLFIAVFNILLMIIIVYFHESNGANWPLIFIKEIPFVLVALYYSTTVNEQADKLKKLLGTTIWSSKDIEEDHTRLFYFTNAEADSISFPLSGMRLKKKDLLLRVAASSLAFVLGLLRSALVNG